MNGRRSVQQERAHNLSVMIFRGPAVCIWSPDNWVAKVGGNSGAMAGGEPEDKEGEGGKGFEVG